MQITEIPPHVVVSPLDSREKIENFIKNSQKEIFIYVQSVTDDSVLRVLEEKSKSGLLVRLCTANNE